MIIFDRSEIITGNPCFDSSIKVRGSKTHSSDRLRRWAEIKKKFQRAKFCRKKGTFFDFFENFQNFRFFIADLDQNQLVLSPCTSITSEPHQNLQYRSILKSNYDIGSVYQKIFCPKSFLHPIFFSDHKYFFGPKITLDPKHFRPKIF